MLQLRNQPLPEIRTVNRHQQFIRLLRFRHYHFPSLLPFVEAYPDAASVPQIGLRLGLLLLLERFRVRQPDAAAAFLDGPSTENWVLPIQLAGMATIGALVGWGTPAIAGPGASTRRRAAVGALLGVGAAVLGVALFFLLLNGVSGA